MDDPVACVLDNRDAYTVVASGTSLHQASAVTDAVRMGRGHCAFVKRCASEGPSIALSERSDGAVGLLEHGNAHKWVTVLICSRRWSNEGNQ
jgi:hypothetical protein